MNNIQIISLRPFMNIVQVCFYNIKKHLFFVLNRCFFSLFVVDILFYNHVIELIKFTNLI
jgi:hypothetical protein